MEKSVKNILGLFGEKCEFLVLIKAVVLHVILEGSIEIDSFKVVKKICQVVRKICQKKWKTCKIIRCCQEDLSKNVKHH